MTATLGHGIPPLKYKELPAGTKGRIDQLVEIAQHLQSAQSIKSKKRRKAKLREVAKCYLIIGMRETAAQVLTQAET